MVAPKPRSSGSNTKAQKASLPRILRIIDLKQEKDKITDAFNAHTLVHPLDMETFGWTNGGILHLDGGKLNDQKHLAKKLSSFMHIDMSGNNNGTSGNTNNLPNGETEAINPPSIYEYPI